MNDLELTIKLSNEYDTCIEHARTQADLRKCHCWFERKHAVDNEVKVLLTSYGIAIRYRTSKGMVQDQCIYGGVLAVTEMREGIMIRLSHKRILFLQAADNREDSEKLMYALSVLEERCSYVFKKSNLRIDKAGILSQIAFRLRKNQGYHDGSGYGNGALVLLICATIFIASVFVLQPVTNRQISKSEAIFLTATYSQCDPSSRRGQTKYVDLEFEDYEELTVDGCCASSDLLEQLDKLPPGTQMHLLVHPESENVLQLVANGEMVLEFHDAQNRIWREAVAFAVMGLFLYGVAVVLVIGMIRKKL